CRCPGRLAPRVGPLADDVPPCPPRRARPPPRLPPAAHARLARRRARAGARSMRLGLRSRAHLVEGGLARALVAGSMRRDLVVERDAHFIEGGFVDAALATACA